MSGHDVGASGEDACNEPLQSSPRAHKLNALRSSDNMRVGDDVPGRIDDETGTNGALRPRVRAVVLCSVDSTGRSR